MASPNFISLSKCQVQNPAPREAVALLFASLGVDLKAAPLETGNWPGWPLEVL